MKEVRVRREHQLGQQACLEIADKITDGLIDRIGGSKSVEGNVIHYKHISGSKGELVATASSLEINVKLGLLVRSLGKSIEQEINEACDKHLG